MFLDTYSRSYSMIFSSVFQAAPKYEYDYKILDNNYGPEFGASEKRTEDHTKGSYFVDLPDGRRQKVSYTVNGDEGYKAKVTYEPTYLPKYEKVGYQEITTHPEGFVSHSKSEIYHPKSSRPYYQKSSIIEHQKPYHVIQKIFSPPKYSYAKVIHGYPHQKSHQFVSRQSGNKSYQYQTVTVQKPFYNRIPYEPLYVSGYKPAYDIRYKPVYKSPFHSGYVYSSHPHFTIPQHSY